MDVDFNYVYKEVEKILGKEKNGHAMDHIDNVINNAKDISSTIKDIDLNVVVLACLLHDVDDYKIVGIEKSKKKENSHRILSNLNISEEAKKHIISICDYMGYSNYLSGIRPNTIEGKIVSDADMLDAIGANGIVRSIVYNSSKNSEFFIKNSFPRRTLDKNSYQNDKNDTSTVNHFFEKLLLIKDIMLTERGKELAQKRHNIMVNFLESYFLENNQKEWLESLEEYK